MSTTTTREAQPVRHCGSINMFTIDRPRPSCIHRTKFCAKRCYNKKLYNTYAEMRAKKCETRLARQWAAIDGATIRRMLSRKRKDVSRFRGCTRGENMATLADIAKWRDIAKANPTTTLWLPTRAWRNETLRAFIDVMLRPLPNVRVMASTDPSNTKAEWQALADAGWSTMFFGDDDLTETPIGEAFIKCPKTWSHQEGACLKCEVGCFRSERLNIHLKEH